MHFVSEAWRFAVTVPGALDVMRDIADFRPKLQLAPIVNPRCSACSLRPVAVAHR
jgi:hypothetical protein